MLSVADYRSAFSKESKHKAWVRGQCIWTVVEIQTHTVLHKPLSSFCSCPSCGQKSEKQTGMYEGLVMAPLKKRDFDTGLFSSPSFLFTLTTIYVTVNKTASAMWHAVKTGMLQQFTMQLLNKQQLSQNRQKQTSKSESTLVFLMFCFASCSQSKKNPPLIAPKFHILYFGSRESISTMWVPVLLWEKRKRTDCVTQPWFLWFFWLHLL